MRELLRFSKDMTHNEAVEYAFSYYQNEIFATNESRMKLFDKFLFIYDKPVTNNKPDMFWHLAGWEDKQVHSIPRYNLCRNNPDWRIICGSNCSSLLHKVKTSYFGERTLCLQRMAKLPRILDIIELVNEGMLDNITMWDYISNSGRHKNEQLYIRYKDVEEDYVVIFQYMLDPDTKNIKRMLLFGAFPVIFKFKRDELEKMFEESKVAPKIKQVLSI